jgi:hypothetical protein
VRYGLYDETEFQRGGAGYGVSDFGGGAEDCERRDSSDRCAGSRDGDSGAGVFEGAGPEGDTDQRMYVAVGLEEEGASGGVSVGTYVEILRGTKDAPLRMTNYFNVGTDGGVDAAQI